VERQAVKRCPTCNQTFTDRNLSFCVDDGTPLVTVPEVDDEATVVRPSSSDSGSSPNSNLPPSETNVPYQPPAYVSPGSGSPKRSNWPLMIGILAVVVLMLGGLGIAAVVLLPKALQRASQSPPQDINVNANANRTYPNVEGNNANANSTITNSNTPVNESAPPSDRDAVLSHLKSLEDEWTVANINADKKKLNQILADDYVGITEGRAQGKAEYLKSIERDTAIQHWEFSDLKVTLTGDRAALKGIIRLDVKDENGQDRQLRYQFTDKFVWRESRWQATSSEVNPVKDDGRPTADGPLSLGESTVRRQLAVEV
jgi:ketosteroid isomerase-like protein